jgi:hypothetical protein
VIDDATTDGGTTEAYADFLAEQDLDVDFALSIFFRGANIAKLENSKYRRAVLLARHIPNFIDWQYFNQTGELKPLE